MQKNQFLLLKKLKKYLKCPALRINPVVPDAHYSERQDEPFSLPIQRLEVEFKLADFYFLRPGH